MEGDAAAQGVGEMIGMGSSGASTEEQMWEGDDQVCGENVGCDSMSDEEEEELDEWEALPGRMEALRPEDSVSNVCASSPPRSPNRYWSAMQVQRAVSLPAHRSGDPPSPLRRTISHPLELLPPFPHDLKASRMQHNAHLIEVMVNEKGEAEREDTFSVASTKGVSRRASMEISDYCPLLL